MAILNGTNVTVTSGGTAIAHTTDCSISLNREYIDVSTKDSGGARAMLARQKSVSISINGLVDTGSTAGHAVLAAAQLAGSTLTIVFDLDDGANDETYSCSCVCTSCELSGGVEDAATFSATLESTGDITRA